MSSGEPGFEYVLSWLRAELRADLATIRQRAPGQWAAVALDTVVMPGLVFRSTIHACVYAINHAERGAATTFRLFARPIDAACWRPRDDVQAATLTVIVAALVALASSAPAAPWLRAVVALAALPIVVDPLQAIAEVADG